MIIHSQFYVRDAGAASKNGQPYAGENASTYAMIGIVEMKDGINVIPEVIYPVHVTIGTAGAAVNFTSQPWPIDRAFAEDDLGNLARSTSWPYRLESGNYTSGGILFRATRAPGDPGTRIFTTLIVTVAPTGSFREGQWLQLEGQFGQRLQSIAGAPIPDDPGKGRGLNLSQLLKLPLWGWNEEPFAFQSTMPLNVIDLCNETQELIGKDSLTQQEAARLETLNASPQSWIWRHRDPQYEQFRKKMAAAGLLRPWDHVMSASQCAEQSRQANAIVRELFS